MDTDLEIRHDGKTYPVTVDHEGMFYTRTEGGTPLKADTLAKLTSKVRKIKTSFELPFTHASNGGVAVRNGTITGIHASNGNVLVSWDNGEKEQLPSWSGDGKYMPRLDAEEERKLRQLISARNTAVRELDAFVKPRAWTSLKQAAEEAREAAAKAAGGEQE